MKRHGKILIIDDDPHMVEAMKMVLKAQDFETHSARNGTERVSKVKEIRPDLIVLDVMMYHLTEGFPASDTWKKAPRRRLRPLYENTYFHGDSRRKKMHIKFSAPETMAPICR